MRSFIVLLISCISFFPMTVQAGSGHSHGTYSSVSSQQIARYAESQLEKLVSSDALNKIWSLTPIAKIKTRAEANQRLWIVMFENEKTADPEKRVLRIFFDEFGYYKGLQFTPTDN